MLTSIFPKQIDNRHRGHRLALWLLSLFVLLRLVMGVNTIFNTRSVAVGADGLDLAAIGAEGARAVLMMFSLAAASQLMLALVALIALIRYRAMVPLVYALLLIEHALRRAIVLGHSVQRTEAAPVGFYLNLGFLALLALGLALSLWKRNRGPAASGADGPAG